LQIGPRKNRRGRWWAGCGGVCGPKKEEWFPIYDLRNFEIDSKEIQMNFKEN
jgi:hypothetical protein